MKNSILSIFNLVTKEYKTFNIEVNYMFITPEMMVDDVIPNLLKDGQLKSFNRDTCYWDYICNGKVEFDCKDEAIN